MNDARNNHTRLNAVLSPGVLLLGLTLLALSFPRGASAGFILDAELRLSYEDNVVGLLSDQKAGTGVATGSTGGMMAPAAAGMGMGGGPGGSTGSGPGAKSKGDFSAAFSAEAGGSRDVSDSASVFAKAFAGHTSYHTYTDFNATVGGAGAGVNARLGDGVYARAAITGKVKRFGDSLRDSSAYGGSISLKEKFTSSFHVREFGEYEKNRADSDLFSYSGAKLGIEAGLSVTRDSLVSIGYSYLDQRYEEPTGAEMKTLTVFASAEHALVKSWTVAAEYDRQISTTNEGGGSATDNIFMLALRYGY